MEYFDKIANLDIPYIVFGIIVIIMLIKFAYECIEWVCSKLGIEFKREREKKEKLQRLIDSENKIKELEEKFDETVTVLNNINTNINGLIRDTTEIKECVGELKDNDLRQNQATIETMHDRITQKSNYYINELKGIPSNELDGYLRMFEAYKGVKGNHGLERLVDYCVNNLPLLPPNNPAGREE